MLKQLCISSMLLFSLIIIAPLAIAEGDFPVNTNPNVDAVKPQVVLSMDLNQQNEEQARSLGQIMVEMIREFLGDKPKPIREDLIRDDE